MKKIFKIGAALATSTLPVIAVVSCGKNGGGDSASGGSGSVQFANGTVPKVATQLSNGSVVDKVVAQSLADNSVTINEAAAKATDDLIKSMNADTDIRWHAIGEPMVDGINAVRYAIYKSSLGINTQRDLLKTYTENVFPVQYTENKPGLNGQDKPFNMSALKDINDWLKGVTATPFISTAIFDETGLSWDNTNYRNKALDPNKLKDMRALRMKIIEYKTTEYRSQQVEWRGDFDGHKWSSTNEEMKHNSSQTNKKIGKPQLWENLPVGGENYIFAYEAKAASVARAKNDSHAKTNIYDALATAISTLYDYNDGSASAGHRYNLYAPDIDGIGYSIVMGGTKNDNFGSYLFTHTDGNYGQKPTTIQDVAARKLELHWLKDTYGQGAVDFAVTYGMTNIDIIKRLIPNYIMNMGGKNVEDAWNKIDTAIKATKANVAVTKADILKMYMDEYAPYGDQMYTNKQIPTDLVATFSANMLGDNRLSSFKEVGFDYTKTNKALLPFDTLGGGTLSSRLLGTQPDTDFEAFFK